MKVRLEIGTGELVAAFTTLPFLKPPEIMVWGSRFFVIDQYLAVRPFPSNEERTVVYREGCPFWLMEGVTAMRAEAHKAAAD